MACQYTYQGKTYEAHEFDDVLKAMPPSIASKYIPGIKATPDGPFIGKDPKPMLALAVKRMIAHAAANGYDKVAFVTGEQSADRYDLSKQVDSVEWTEWPAAGKDHGILVARKDGDEVIKKTVPSSELESLVGKDVARNLLAAKPDMAGRRTIEGDGLKVGGEGMKSFYDSIVPQVVNDVLKKVGGGRVESVKVTTRDPFDGGTIRIASDGSNYWAERTKTGERLSKNFDSYLKADDARLAVYDAEEKGATPQPGFTITPEMREKVAGGQALFSRKRFEPSGHERYVSDLKTALSQLTSDDKDTRNRGAAFYFKVMDVPPVLRSIVAKDGSKPFKKSDQGLWGSGSSIASKATNTHAVSEHGKSVDPKVVMRLPQLVADPIAVFSSEGGMNSKSYRVLVPGAVVAIEPKERRGFIMTIHPVRGENVQQWAEGGLLHYINEKAASRAALLEALPVGQFHKFPQVDWSMAQTTAKVNGRTVVTSDDIERLPAPALSTPRIIGDSSRTYTPEQQKAFANTGRTVADKTIRERIAGLRAAGAKRLAQLTVDQFRPVRDLGNVPYMLLRLSKGAPGAFEAFLNHGKLSVDAQGVYDADTSGGVMEKVFFKLGKESSDFLYWIAGNRAERLMSEGKENLFSAEDIAAYKSLATGDTDFDYQLSNGTVTRKRALIYRDALKVFNEFNQNILDVAQKSGLIDGASRHLWEHEFYVPFYRVLSEEDDTGVRGANIKGGVVRQKAFEKLKGGEEGLNDLLGNVLMNWAHLIDASAKNRGAALTLKAAERMGAAQKAQPGDKNVVWHMAGGKKVEYSVSDPYLLEAITALEYSGIAGPVMDVLTTSKHWLTIGVTASPYFKVRNLIRDSLQAIGTAPLNYNPITNVYEGFKLTNRESQDYVSALAAGGLIRFGTMLEGNAADRTRQLIKKGAKDAHILDNESKLRAFYDKWLEPGIAAYNEIGNRGEEINRMALYKQLKDQGMSHGEAALAARDLMDFSMQGTAKSIRFLSQVVPFFNARLQGMYKLGRAAKEDPARFATVLMGVAMASLALLAAYKDDEDWKKREEWDRDNYWWFKFGDIAYRIPKPFEIGAIATLAERTAELIFDKEMTGQRFAKVTTELLKNQLSMNPVPQLFKPMIDIYSNKDSFTGRPIENMAMQKLDPSKRERLDTSIVAKGISKAGNAVTGENFLSPVQVDHLIRGYFGWLGGTSVATADELVRMADDRPDRPTRDYYKLLSGGMVAELDSAGSRYVTQMYEQAKELEQAHATWRKMQKEGKVEEAAEYREDNKDKLAKYGRVEGVKKQESRLNERIRMIERSNLSGDVKREKITEIKKQQNELAKRLYQ